MAKKSAKEIVVLIAQSEASAKMKWLFLKNHDGKWSLPIFKKGFIEHPMIRAVKSALYVFGDITNIELWFELEGETHLARIYTINFEFDKVFQPAAKFAATAWHNPVVILGSENVDDLTFSIIEVMIQAMQKMEGGKKRPTKSNPLEIIVNPKK